MDLLPRVEGIPGALLSRSVALGLSAPELWSDLWLFLFHPPDLQRPLPSSFFPVYMISSLPVRFNFCFAAPPRRSQIGRRGSRTLRRETFRATRRCHAPLPNLDISILTKRPGRSRASFLEKSRLGTSDPFCCWIGSLGNPFGFHAGADFWMCLESAGVLLRMGFVCGQFVLGNSSHPLGFEGWERSLRAR